MIILPSTMFVRRDKSISKILNNGEYEMCQKSSKGVKVL